MLRNYVTQLIPKPDYIVINEGLWPTHGFSGVMDEQNGTSVFHEIKKVLDEWNIHGIYKTTTKYIRGRSVTLNVDECG